MRNLTKNEIYEIYGGSERYCDLFRRKDNAAKDNTANEVLVARIHLPFDENSVCEQYMPDLISKINDKEVGGGYLGMSAGTKYFLECTPCWVDVEL